MRRLRTVYVCARQVVADRRLECERRRVTLQRMRGQSSPHPIVIGVTFLPQAPYGRQLLRHRNGQTVCFFLSGLDTRLDLRWPVIGECTPSAFYQDLIGV